MLKRNMKRAMEAYSLLQLLAGMLDPCHGSEAVFPGACKVRSRWVAAILYSRIDINLGMVVIFTSLQRLFECHPGWQINLFSVFKNVTKSFS